MSGASPIFLDTVGKTVGKIKESNQGNVRSVKSSLGRSGSETATFVARNMGKMRLEFARRILYQYSQQFRFPVGASSTIVMDNPSLATGSFVNASNMTTYNTTVIDGDDSNERRHTSFQHLAFGCNLDEIELHDLRSHFPLDGVSPVADAALVSPADGRTLHFSRVDVNGDGMGELGPVRVEQVKGIIFLNAPPGVKRPSSPDSNTVLFYNPKTELVNHREFANINGIEHSPDQLIGSTTPNGTSTPPRPASPSSTPQKFVDQADARKCLSSPATNAASPLVVPSNLSALVTPSSLLSYTLLQETHRFHSLTAWVVEKQRHFIAKRLENLFIFDERVALPGRWKHGLFSVVPVGATNVGSIKINFDNDLRTNDRRARGEGLPSMGTYTEAVYSLANPILRGQPLELAQEIGGFCLGREKVKVGQRLGDVVQRLEERVLPELDGDGKVKKN
ncbi:hypothetical protein P691DRAFT_765725 [Macrolepiota fuliginosa MF-IS2]|uniref:Uncharacterized protein n=1 Tax=Macrolepiota fuliginosa MF-IS2 TaxID=1400762 RepID=A0A9P5X1L5_9AGAR|nr:hypothetical protein P691DRAFT_765725 [Macrolepiota fuliginosa MF-IS2]